jgi:thiosulfate/3-mercaptopyruvate sulfurtransferase
MSAPSLLVTTAWLADHLGDPDLRLLDSTVENVDGRYVADRAGFEAGHIPGAQFVDLQGDISDQNSRLSFTAPQPADFARAMERFGVGEGTRVVVYSRGNFWWATRVWWLLRLFGFDAAAVLDGGWKAWVAEGRPIETGAGRRPPPGRFAVHAARPVIAGKERVLAAVGDGSTCTINALPAASHSGAAPSSYGRSGHIKGSVNVPGVALIDPASGRFRPRAEIEQMFRDAGALDKDTVISYCGGGITATATAFALALIGRPDPLVYDGSLQEWAADERLPMVTG